jgi:hypothetical protein
VTDDIIGFPSVSAYKLLPCVLARPRRRDNLAQSKGPPIKDEQTTNCGGRHLAFSFPIGAFAECLALYVLMSRGCPTCLENLVATWLYTAPAFSAIASAIAMYRAIMTVEEKRRRFRNESPSTQKARAIYPQSRVSSRRTAALRMAGQPEGCVCLMQQLAWAVAADPAPAGAAVAG